MNLTSFDNLTKTLGATRTRRGLLWAFVASVTGVAIGIPARVDAFLKYCKTTADCPEELVCAAAGYCIGNPEFPESCRQFCTNTLDKICLPLLCTKGRQVDTGPTTSGCLKCKEGVDRCYRECAAGTPLTGIGN
jgi:hypothetical protein